LDDLDEDSRSELYQSRSPAQWDGQYPVVFVPERRRQAVFGATRSPLGPISHAWARPKECRILEGPLLPDHVPMCMAIPPKHPVSSVIGFINGKSAIAMARLHGQERSFTGEPFWARGYAVSTVGFEWGQVRQSIREQEDAHGSSGQF
jgi:putative transposase